MIAPNRLRLCLLGQESLKIDLKWDYDFDSDIGKRKFAKDIVSLANTPADEGDECGYLVLGVPDPRQKSQLIPSARFQPFGDEEAVLDFNDRLQKIVDHHCDPTPNIVYGELLDPTVYGERIGIITVNPPLARPVFTKNMGAPQEDGIAWIRSGPGDPHKRWMTRAEIKAVEQQEQEKRIKAAKVLSANIKPFEYKENIVGPRLRSIKECIQGLVNLDPAVRKSAVRGLRRLTRANDERRRLHTQILLGMLEDQDNLVVLETVRALSRIGHEIAVQWLVKLCYEHASDDIIFEAVGAIGEIGSEEAIPQLKELESNLDSLLDIQNVPPPDDMHDRGSGDTLTQLTGEDFFAKDVLLGAISEAIARLTERLL